MIYVGSLQRLTFTVKNAAGALTDPGTLECDLLSPLGAVTTYTLANGDFSKSSTGTYTLDVSLPTAGAWAYRATSTGPVAAFEGQLQVEKSAF